MTSGALRDPGLITAWRMPFAAQSRASSAAV
jgi:hypothetical protein